MSSNRSYSKPFFVVIAVLWLGWWGGPAPLALESASANSRPGFAAVQPLNLPPARPLHDAGLSISQSATSTVYNGEWITYTLTIANSGAEVKEIHVEDQLPAGVLANAECLTEVGNCSIEYDTTSVTVRNGGTVQVSQPIRVKWDFVSTGKLPQSFPLSLRFRAQVLCQPVGSQFSNQATLMYVQTNGTPGFAISAPLFLDTTVAQAPIAQQGHFSMSSAPELCTKSGPVGGTTDMDWGDFDNDGDLDLALVSWDGGVFVYRNKGQGQFELFWNGSAHPAESVQWADFDGKSNGYLELMVGGDFSAAPSSTPDGGSYGFTGKNYLYQFNGSNGFAEYDQFETNDGVWRAAAADFSGDGYPDLAVLNSRGGCVVHLYKNDQTGKFNRSDPGSTASSSCLLGAPYDSSAKAYSAAWGDVDNDGDPDLAVGHNYVSGSVTNLIRVYKNNSGVLVYTNNIEIENVVNPAANFRYAQDLAWGDYDGDGDLDLAAAFASDTYLDFS
ncbi:MAG: VCBS repeat-containing protein, partial [Anaerolineae bacterium]|nr:VCBS repeat-containing protein [Anaerolineae bacterium]